MIDGVDKFIKQINDNKNKSENEIIYLACVRDVLRVKNGFGNILDWKNESDAEYCDIKLNIAIKHKNIGGKETVVIGEVQFLLEWLLTFKKMGHRLYSVHRFVFCLGWYPSLSLV